MYSNGGGDFERAAITGLKTLNNLNELNRPDIVMMWWFLLSVSWLRCSEAQPGLNSDNSIWDLMKSLWMGLSSGRMRRDISPAGDHSQVSRGRLTALYFILNVFFPLLWIPSLTGDVFTVFSWRYIIVTFSFLSHAQEGWIMNRGQFQRLDIINTYLSSFLLAKTKQ